jgi:hypothetical protein
MSTSAIVKREEQLARLRARLATVRDRVDTQAARIQRLAVSAGAAYVAGAVAARAAAEHRPLFTVAGLPPVLTWAGLAYLAGPMVGKRTGELLEDAAAGLLAAYAYELGQGR